MMLISLIILTASAVKIAKASANRDAGGLIPTGIAAFVIGVFMLIVSLIAEPGYPDFSLFDVLFILPMLFKIIAAELNSALLTVASVILIVTGISDIVAGGILRKKYGSFTGSRRLSAAELAQKTVTLENDYVCGYLTKEEYEEQMRILHRRSDRTDI